MRNTSEGISSIPFGTDMHKKVCISKFGEGAKAFSVSKEVFVNPNAHIHLKPAETSNPAAPYICHNLLLD